MIAKTIFSFEGEILEIVDILYSPPRHFDNIKIQGIMYGINFIEDETDYPMSQILRITRTVYLKKKTC